MLLLYQSDFTHISQRWILRFVTKGFFNYPQCQTTQEHLPNGFQEISHKHMLNFLCASQNGHQQPEAQAKCGDKSHHNHDLQWAACCDHCDEDCQADHHASDYDAERPSIDAPVQPTQKNVFL
jgi:hypothetical protein